MSSNPTPASALPPFIPGLLIISLLIIVSLLIGWRNWVRRGQPETVTAWMHWAPVQPSTGQAVNKKDKPKMWEVMLEERGGGLKYYEHTDWEKSMPLAATCLGPGLPPEQSPTQEKSELPSNKGASSPLPWLPRLHYFTSPSSSAAASSEMPTPEKLPAAFHNLQLSFIISMPDPEHPIYQPMPSSPLSQAMPSQPQDEKESMTPSSSMAPNISSSTEAEEGIGPPEVAFGVIVVPWGKRDEEDEQPRKDDVSAES